MYDLEIKISGAIQSSNFPLWKSSFLSQVDSISLNLSTDQDFAIAIENAKFLKKAEAAIKEAKIKAISQTQEIQSLFHGLDEILEKSRSARLKLERQVKKRKEEIKNYLIDSFIADVKEHIFRKDGIFSQLDNSKYLARHQYESCIKGKSTVLGVSSALSVFAQQTKNLVDNESNRIIKNHEIIELIDINFKYLFQDIKYLILLPEQELHDIIKSRKTKFLEQKSPLFIENSEKEIKNISEKELFENKSEEKACYVITIEIYDTRTKIINKAREIKSFLEEAQILMSMKLNLKKD